MESFSLIWYSFLLVNVQLLVWKVDATITWTLPSPQRGPLTIGDTSPTRTTVQKLDGRSPELRLEWNFTLSGESLIRISWMVGATNLGRKFKSGAVTLNAAFEGNFDISPSDLATLIIYNNTAADGKKFTCTVVTDQRNSNDIIMVFIYVSAKVTEIRGDKTVREGGILQLTCEASGKPEPNITWTKRETGNQGNTDLPHKGKVLNIANVSRNDSGIFNCTAYNGFGIPDSLTVYVNVTYPAKIVKFQPENIVGVQQSIILNCEAEGNPPPTYTWTPCDTEQVCDKNTLVISQVLNDANYTCRAANALEVDLKSARVYIGGNVINITIVITSESCNARGYNETIFEKKFEEVLNRTLAGKLGYERVLLIVVRCGSINVDLALKFNSITKEQDVITTLIDALSDGKLGEFSVSSIKGTRQDVATTSPTTTSSDRSPGGTDWWVFFLIALGAAFFFGFVIGICCWKFGPCCTCCLCWDLCTKDKASKEVHSDGGQDVEMEVGYSSADIQYAAAGPNTNYRASNQFSAPPATYEVANRRSEGRRGNGPSELKEPPPQYAVVDKTKKKKKTPKPGELQYAELGEPTGPRLKAVLPRVSGTDTVYSDIRT